MNSGRLELEPATFDLIGLLNDTLAALELVSTYAKAPLRLTAPESLTCTLDRLAVEQVIDNIVSNALKYGAGAPIEVTATVVEGENVVLAVRDHGPGMDAEDCARIFERFEQAVGQRSHGGFGIGLWLSRELVEAMEGSIAVDSAVGEGTTFTVRLPVSMKKANEGQAAT